MAELYIITGASRGIGLSTAILALDQGARVLNLSRTPCPDPRVENFAVDWIKVAGKSIYTVVIAAIWQVSGFKSILARAGTHASVPIIESCRLTSNFAINVASAD